MMKILEDRVQRCTRCGMCQAVCPLYAATGHEKDVARGKLQLLDGLMREMFQDPGGVEERIHHCLLCGACEAGCPRQVSVLEIFLTARSIITAYQGLSPVKKFFFRRIMAHPDLFDRLMEWSARFNLYSSSHPIKADASCSQLVSPILSNRHLVPIAPVAFHQMSFHAGKTSPRTGPKVAFFVGCLLDKLFPEHGKNHCGRIGVSRGKRRYTDNTRDAAASPCLPAETGNHLTGWWIIISGLFDAEDFDYSGNRMRHMHGDH